MKKLLLFLMLIPAFVFSQELKIININPDGWGGVINIDPGNSLDLLLDSVQNWIWVSKDNQTGTETGTMIYPYNTIQEGLDAASEDMVVVVLVPRDNSTYQEHLVMSTNNVRLMTLEGQTVAVELQSVGAMGLDIAANGLIIGGGSGNGFTFTGDAGLMIVIDAVRTDVEISYNDISPVAGSIAINPGAAGTVGLKILYNTFHIADGDGAFYAGKNLKDFEIIGNEFIARKGSSTGYAIQMTGFLNGIIADNYIHADTIGTPGISYGIFLHTATSDSHASDSVEIYGNSIQDCKNGISIGHSTQTSDLKAVFIFNNILQRNVDGIDIANDTEVYPATYEIYNNIFDDNTTDINNNHSTDYNGINIIDGAFNLIEFKSSTIPVLTIDANGDVDTLPTADIGDIAIDNSVGMTVVSTEGMQTIGTGGTFERLNEGSIAYTAFHLHDFTHDDGRLTYTGTNTKHFVIHVHLNIESDQAGLIQIQLYKDGALVPLTNDQHDFAVIATDVGLNFIWLEEMATGEYVEVWGTSDTNGDTFDLHSGQIVISQE